MFDLFNFRLHMWAAWNGGQIWHATNANGFAAFCGNLIDWHVNNWTEQKTSRECFRTITHRVAAVSFIVWASTSYWLRLVGKGIPTASFQAWQRTTRTWLFFKIGVSIDSPGDKVSALLQLLITSNCFTSAPCCGMHWFEWTETIEFLGHKRTSAPY